MTTSEEIYQLYIQFMDSKRKHLIEVKSILSKTEDLRYKAELEKYIEYLSHVPPTLLRGGDGRYVGKNIDWNLIC